MVGVEKVWLWIIILFVIRRKWCIYDGGDFFNLIKDGGWWDCFIVKIRIEKKNRNVKILI